MRVWRLLAFAIFASFFCSCTQVAPTVKNDPSLSYTEANGYRFHTAVFGKPDDPPVIVVHGGPGADFRYLLPLKELSNKYHVIFYDQRGAGLSPREGTEGFTIDQFVKDLDGLVNIYSKDRPVRLIGHSWGGMLVTAYLGKHPEKVSHAVIAEPGMLNKEAAMAFADLQNRSSSVIDQVNMVPYFISALFVKSEDGHERKDYVMTKILGSAKGAPFMCKGEALPPGSIARAGFASFETMTLPLMKDPKLFNYNLADGIEKYNGRLLLMSSECSFVGYEYQEKYHLPLYPKSTRHVMIEGTGHYMMTNKASESMRVMREFFEERQQ